MDSRLRPSPESFFEVFVEIARPTEPSEDPFIIQKYPDDYNDKEVLKVLPKFVFPCVSESTTVDHFTFVLTDIDSRFRFCFCRHATGAQTGLCIVSWLPWFEIFYKLLNYLAELTNRTDGGNTVSLLHAFYNQPLPSEPGELCDIITPNFSEKFSFTIPNSQSLPTIPDNRNLTEYYNAVDTNNMMLIFASMLYERRILIVSRKLSRLTACVHASASLLYPMFWQHLYIPILPPHMLDYCSAPMPYLIGIHSSMLQKLKFSELGDAVILDADKNIVQTQYDDLSTLPSDVVSGLKKRLRGHGSDKNMSAMVGDWLARSFLKALVALIGGYRDALRFRPGENISFEEAAFLQSRPAGMRAFLENMLQLQTFEQFINGRLHMLNSGKGFADEFEMENNMMGDKWGTRSRYKEWTNNMKKLQKGGKDRLVEFTGKVKDKSKKAYSNFMSRIDDLRDSPEKSPGGSPNALRRGRPQTIPVSSLRPQRPPRPHNSSFVDAATKSSDGALNRRPTDVHSRQYKILQLETATESHSPRVSKRQSSDDSAVDMSYNRVSLDLMQDQDIQAVFKKSYSLEDLAQVSEESEASSDPETPTYTELNKGGDAESNTVQRTSGSRPVPAPRTSLHRESSVPVLSTPAYMFDQNLAKSSDNVCSTARPVNNNSTVSLKTNSSEDSLENIRLEDAYGSCEDTSVMKPRSIVMRKPAFKSNSRPVSLIRDSPVPQAMDAVTINEARTAFMKTESIPKSLNSSGTSLEDFDPLVTGQLAVDDKSRCHQEQSGEENLLKDWTGIDFTKRNPPGPRLPPKTQPMQKPVGYVNMMASQYNAAYSNTAFPQMGVAARLPVQNVRPPMMKPLVSKTAISQRPMSMYSTTPAQSPLSQQPLHSSQNQAFLHTVRQPYCSPQANLKIHNQAWPPASNHSTAAQDPFTQVLQQAKPPMIKPLHQPTSVIAQTNIQKTASTNTDSAKANGGTQKWETFE